MSAQQQTRAGATLELVPTVPILTAEQAVVVAVELAAELAVGAAERDAQRLLPAVELDALSASGLLGITVPAEHGGADLPAGTVAEVLLVRRGRAARARTARPLEAPGASGVDDHRRAVRIQGRRLVTTDSRTVAARTRRRGPGL